jgi:predicted lipoprotein with Yx(FWY)xxD motif
MALRRIEEMSDMNGTQQAIEAKGSRRVPVLRLAGAVVAAGGLSAAVVAADTAGAATSSVVSTTKTSKYGTILVSGKTTVYILKASAVACGSGCLKIWPEVLLPKGVTTATAGPGVNAANLGTVAGTGGALQVTYGGKPLYWFYKDTRPGQVGGNITDKWGKWSAVVTVKPAHGSSGSGGTNAGSGGVSF